jgi:hypothetical protein
VLRYAIDAEAEVTARGVEFSMVGTRMTLA